MTEESMEVHLARIEEKLDALDKRLLERCAISGARLSALEQSIIKQGERIGRLEAENHRIGGGKAAIMAMLTGAGVVGGLLAKLFEQVGK